MPLTIASETAAIVVQTPDFYGALRNVEELAEIAHDAGALLIVVVTEIVSLGLLEAPGALGADIVVCEGQSMSASSPAARSMCGRCRAASPEKPWMPRASAVSC